jgi:hypothetical protein
VILLSLPSTIVNPHEPATGHSSSHHLAQPMSALKGSMFSVGCKENLKFSKILDFIGDKRGQGPSSLKLPGKKRKK